MREPLCFIIVYAGLGEASGEWRWSKVVLILALNLVWGGNKIKRINQVMRIQYGSWHHQGSCVALGNSFLSINLRTLANSKRKEKLQTFADEPISFSWVSD